MEFNSLAEVPTAIQPFYKEVTTEVPTGTYVEETFEYQDSNGVTRTGTRTVEVMETVTKALLKETGEFKTMEDVWRVVETAKGSGDVTIRNFLGMVNNFEAWRFCNKYLVWFTAEPQPDEERFLVWVNEMQEYSQEMYLTALTEWQAREPQGYPVINIDQWFLDNAEALRKAAYPSMEEQMRLQFEDMMNGTTKWRDTMQAVNEQYPLPS